MSIHKEFHFDAPPTRIYEILTDADAFGAATGRPAAIGSEEGEAFSIFGNYISGRTLELIPGERVVQAWRGMDWEPGVYSCVRFTLMQDDTGTTLKVDHSGYPAGPSPTYPTWREHLAANWSVFYFDPISRYLAA